MSFSIDVFRNMLRINKHRLDDELEIHAETMERISSHVSKLNALHLERKKSLDQEEAIAVAEAKEDDPKLSNPLAEKEAKRSSRYKTAWNLYATAKQEYEEWLGLLNAWTARGYQIKTLADLYGNQYYAIDTVRKRDDDTSLRAQMRAAAERRVAEREQTPAPAAQLPRRRPIT